MATALDTIPLQEVKDYLKVDFADDDIILTRIIGTAVALVEKHTSHRLYPREVVLRGVKNGYELYDYPYSITSLVDVEGAAIEYNVEPYALSDKIHFGYSVSHRGSLALTVGYESRELIPEPLITACYRIINYLYEHRDLKEAVIPSDIYSMLQPYRRYATI